MSLKGSERLWAALRKPKARRSTGNATKPKESQADQSARFIETARTIGIDESGREFEKALRRLVPRRRPTRIK
jgi:hypothetical protein